MNRLALVVLLAASMLNAQEATPEVVRRVVDVKHLSGDRADRAVLLVRAYMHPVGTINFDQSLRTAVLIGPEQVVAGAEALLSKFDSPGAIRPDRQVQLRIHLVEAVPDASGGTVPAEIAPAVEQMKKNFAYKGYRHVDTMVVIGKDGMTGAGTVYSPEEGVSTHRITYNFRVQSSSVLQDGKTVALKNFSFQMRVPYSTQVGAANMTTQATETSVNTDLTIQQGQKLVVGKLAAPNPQNATFLILTAEVQ